MVNCNQMKTQLDEKGQMLITQDSIIYIHRAILNKVPLAGLSSVRHTDLFHIHARLSFTPPLQNHCSSFHNTESGVRV